MLTSKPATSPETGGTQTPTPHTDSGVSPETKGTNRNSSPDTRPRRRASSDQKKNGPGYPKVGPGYPKRAGYPKKDNYGYPKTSMSSDETKRRRAEKDKERCEEMQKTQGYSPECYIISIAVSTLVLIGLIGATVYVIKLPFPDDKVSSHETYAPETTRKVLVIMSDNLDCSLYMKRQTMQRVDLREVMLAGLQCLYINEPHSVAPDSAISMMFYYRQEREHMAHNLERNLLNKSCRVGNPDNTNCSQYGFLQLSTSRADLSARDFMHKKFATEYALESQYYNKAYKAAFRKLARFEDCGEDHPFPQAMFSNAYNRTCRKDRKSDPTRVFRISKLMNKMLKSYGKNVQFARNYTDVFQISAKTKRKDKIVITDSVTRNVVNNFLYQSSARTAIVNEAKKLRLRGKEGRLTTVPYVIYHNGPTHSIFAAFIVKTVYIDWPKTTPLTEEEVMAAIMKAQRLAYHYFVFSKEWSGDPNGVSMMNRVIAAVEHLKKNGKMSNLARPIRKAVDRSASMILWYRGNKEEFHLLGASLPKPFQSSHIQNGTERGEFSRFEVTAQGKTYRSVPFMSYTGLVVVEEMNQDPDTNHPQFIAGCSGSVRNVEAVATSVLMQMLFNHTTPGKAVWNSSIFLDVRDATMYCDHGSKDDQKYRDNVKTFYEKVTAIAGLKCHSMKNNELEHKDRILMLASRPAEPKGKIRESLLNTNEYMTGSIDPRAEDYNYAVGY